MAIILCPLQINTKYLMEFSSDYTHMSKENEISPLKIGVRCKQPAITLKYKSGENKRMRIMPVRFLNKYGTATIDSVMGELKKKHKEYLQQVPDIKIKKMLRILQEIQKGTDIQKASKIVNNEFSVDPNQDLNKLSDIELAQKKQVMENNFLKNQLKEGDPDFQYDIQVDYESNDKIDAGWDSEGDDADFWS